MTAQQKISAAILAEMARNGGNLAAAVNAVLGAGAYERIAGDLYDRLRAAR